MRALQPIPTLPIAALLPLVLLAAACSDDPAPTTSAVGCRLHSDCPATERCVEAECVPADPDDSSCRVDTDCGPTELCDFEAGRCAERACDGDAECELAHRCQRGQCIVDTTADRDYDGVPDAIDLCPTLINPDQEDLDGDGEGDLCDRDDDGDTIDDPDDNCPTTTNPEQHDADGDGLGDACEPDRDRDAVPDDVDNCLATPNDDQADADGDALGDACDPNDDDDTTLDADDNCPNTTNPDQHDADDDGLGNACDPDWAGVTVTGRLVTDPPNPPSPPNFSLARVRLAGPGLPTNTVPVQPDGRFTLPDHILHDGLYQVVVEWPGWLVPTAPFGITTDVAQFDLGELTAARDEAARLTGRARHSGRDDHGGILVAARRLPDLALIATALTDHDGAFALPASSSESYELRFTSDGFGALLLSPVTWDDGAFGLDGAPIDVALEPRAFDGALTVTVDVNPDWIPASQRTARVRVVGPDAFDHTITEAADLAPTIVPIPSAGSFTVFASRDGFTFDQRTVTLTPDAPNAAVTLHLDLTHLAAARLDLSGVPLPQGGLDAIDLSRANLAGADLRGLVLAGRDLTDANLTNAQLDGADLSCAELDGANLFGAVLDRANLARVRAQRANFGSASLHCASLADTPAPADGCEPTAASHTCQPHPAPFAGARLVDADLTRADLGGVVLRGDGPLPAARLDGANLELARLDGADLTRVSATQANLDDASLVGAQASSSVFVGAVLRRVVAHGANFDDASFESTVFDAAVFGCDVTRYETELLQSGDDRFEDNNTARRAAPIAPGTYFDLQQLDPDYYMIHVDAAQLPTTLRVDVFSLNGYTAPPITLIAPNGDTTRFNTLDGRALAEVRVQTSGDWLVLVGCPPGDVCILPATQYALRVGLGDDYGTICNETTSLPASMVGAHLDGAILIGSNFTGVNASDASLIGVSFANGSAPPAGQQPLDCILYGVRNTHPECSFENLVACPITEQTLPCFVASTSIAGASLRGANARGLFLSNVAVIATDFTEATAPGSQISEGWMVGTRFDHANLYGLVAPGVAFDGADLVGANLAFANLQGASLSNVTLSHCDTTDPCDLADIERCRQQGLVANLDGASLRHAELIRSDLRGVVLARTDLSDADFYASDLGCADFDSASLFRTSLNSVDATRADFTNTDLTQAAFDFADAPNATFTRAILERTDFTATSMTGCVLASALLFETNLSATNLSGCTSNGNTTWRDPIFSPTTICPNGRQQSTYPNCGLF